MLCSVLLSITNWKSLFLFVLQQFPWWVTKSTGLLLFFVPPFLSFNTWQLYLRDNALLFGCFCTMGSCQGTAGEECGYISSAVVASSLLARSFPISLFLLQYCVVFKAAPSEGHANICGAVWEYSVACTGILTLHPEWAESAVTDKPYGQEWDPSTSKWDAWASTGETTNSLKFTQCIH